MGFHCYIILFFTLLVTACNSSKDTAGDIPIFLQVDAELLRQQVPPDVDLTQVEQVLVCEKNISLDGENLNISVWIIKARSSEEYFQIIDLFSEEEKLRMGPDQVFLEGDPVSKYSNQSFILEINRNTPNPPLVRGSLLFTSSEISLELELDCLPIVEM